jgi:hypothetical protein
MMVMRFKSFLLALPLVAFAVPVAAQDVFFAPGTGVATFEDAPVRDADNESEMMVVADKMSDPAMRLPVGQFAEAIENARPGTVNKRIRRDATVADLAGRDAEYLPEKLGAGSRQIMGMMSGFARAFAVMMPEFERMGREMEDSFRAAKADAKRQQN